jgi:hypothetical protein
LDFKIEAEPAKFSFPLQAHNTESLNYFITEMYASNPYEAEPVPPKKIMIDNPSEQDNG